MPYNIRVQMSLLSVTSVHLLLQYSYLHKFSLSLTSDFLNLKKVILLIKLYCRVDTL